MKTIIFFFAVILISTSAFAQKIYIPSAKKYISIVEYTDDIQTDLTKFAGGYLLLYPGEDQNGISEGDVYIIQLEIKISKDAKTVSAIKLLQIPDKDASKKTILTNPTVYENVFNSEELTAKFVVIKYKIKDKFYFIKGILKKHEQDSGYDFYEKTQ